jgi:hypothetical protein
MPGLLKLILCLNENIRIDLCFITKTFKNIALNYIKKHAIIINHDFYFLKQSIKSKLSMIIFFNRALWAKEIIGFFSPCSQKISKYRIIL